MASEGRGIIILSSADTSTTSFCRDCFCRQSTNLLFSLVSIISFFSLHYFPLDEMLGQRLFGIFDKNGDEKINAAEFMSMDFLPLMSIKFLAVLSDIFWLLKFTHLITPYYFFKWSIDTVCIRVTNCPKWVLRSVYTMCFFLRLYSQVKAHELLTCESLFASQWTINNMKGKRATSFKKKHAICLLVAGILKVKKKS